MKNLKLFSLFLMAIVCVVMNSRCSLEQEIESEDPAGNGINQDLIPRAVEMEPALTRWTENTHNNITDVCAWQWGFSSGRRNNMKAASEMPDTYQSGIDNGFNQQWSHAYIYHSWGFWVWGDADDDFHDNIDGDSGES